MKTFVSTIFMVTTCTFTFLSCSKKKDVIPQAKAKGSVVFWTKNTALLASCSNDITIRLLQLVPIGGSTALVIDTLHIINTDAAAPSSCTSTTSAKEIIVAQFYVYQLKDCGTGIWKNFIDFNVISGECLKIEIP